MESTALTLATLLSGATSVLTWVCTSIASIFTAVTASPVAMVFIYFALIGVVVGFAKKLLHV